MELEKLCEFGKKIVRNWSGTNHESLKSEFVTNFLKLADSQFEPLKNKIINANLHSQRDFMVFLTPLLRSLESNVDSKIVVEKNDRNERSFTLPHIFILDNFRSAHNIGSVIRTADCFGIKRLVMTGYSAGIENQKVLKCSLGAQEGQDISYYPLLEDALTELEKEGFQTAALETTSNANNFFEEKHFVKTAFIFGVRFVA